MRLIRATADSAANRYGLVLMLLAVVYVASVSIGGEISSTVVTLLQLVTLWLVFSASESRTAQRIAGYACVVLATAIVVGSLIGHQLEFDDAVVRWVSVISFTVYLLAPWLILKHLISRQVVDARTLLGAICVYLMLGMAFAFAYRSISLFQADPFFGDAGNGDTPQFLFFSFITLTTTGYGNLVPADNPGQTVAVLETIVGQLFLVIAVAKIVNSWTAKPTPEPD